MQTKIVIRDFERTENLEDYLQGKIEDSIYPFLQQFPDSQVQVTVNEDRHRSSTRKPHFECTVLLNMNHPKSVIRVHRSSDHFYTCVQEVTETLTGVLRRKHRQLSSLQARRRPTLNDIPYLEEPLLESEANPQSKIT
ncbi:MAG: hypothetical protein A2622_12560 [Bdellovibrionales bacterium RIFCSPHIGHO2_01_FULL_40_29]|nr:MAG: hypothetical protein A2622_12560 [Bdellovibrionales bacterium RIFCSPHIGHO2_01_FULL_40_29]OFZ33013.1 MAG: hypothetical protein A3D17_09865 [Bdellovibrionales bacterium RIFCSPHIGHO2_02_FULL_40_15]